MATITDKLNQLESDRQDLVDNLETMGITGLSGDETFTELVPEVLNIPAGADLSDYFTSTLEYNSSTYQGSAKNMIKTIPSTTTVSGTNLKYVFYQFKGLITLPVIDTSNVTDMEGMCNGCVSLVSFPALDTSNVKNMSYMFNACGNLTTFPALSIPKATNMQSMFYDCTAFTDTSLDNILQMCISATSFNGTKTLAYLSITNASVYPASRIEALPHYQDFLDAGWTLGY